MVGTQINLGLAKLDREGKSGKNSDAVRRKPTPLSPRRPGGSIIYIIINNRFFIIYYEKRLKSLGRLPVLPFCFLFSALTKLDPPLSPVPQAATFGRNASGCCCVPTHRYPPKDSLLFFLGFSSRCFFLLKFLSFFCVFFIFVFGNNHRHKKTISSLRTPKRY